MELTVDEARRGEPLPHGRRSPARIAMDAHVDTDTWMSTEVATSDVETVKKRLYTLANKAGYSLRTEIAVKTEADGDSDGISVLRLLVRSKARRGGRSV